MEKSLALLKKISLILSTSSSFKEVNVVQNVLAKEFELIGASTRLLENSNKNEKGLLLEAYFNNNKAKDLVFIGHSDVIDAFKNFKGDWIENDASVSYPGVVDAKGGTVLLWQALKLNHEKIKHFEFNVKVVLSPNEETGSTGWHSYFAQCAHKAFLVLGLEPSDPKGNIISARRGNHWVEITAKGKEVHSGRDWEQGIDASMALSKLIAFSASLIDSDKNIHLSLGSLLGGKGVFNLMSEKAGAYLDIRFDRLEQVDDVVEQLKQEASKITEESGAQFEFIVRDHCPSFVKNENSAKYIKSFCQAFKQVANREIVDFYSKGAADTCHFYSEHLAVLDGFGVQGTGMHTENEILLKKDFEQRAQALASFISTLKPDGEF